MQESYKAKHIVFIGGGHTHALVLKEIAMHPIADLAITLISSPTHTPYSGMLPGYLAGAYSFDETHIDLHRLCIAAGATFINDRVVNIDPIKKLLSCRHHPIFSYDIASINIGSTPQLDQIPGAKEFAVGVKPIDKLLACVDGLKKEAKTNIAVIGAGAGGFELVLSLRQRLGDEANLSLVSANASPLIGYRPALRRKALAALKTAKVDLLLGNRVTQVNKSGLELANNQQHSFDMVIAATEAAPAKWFKDSQLPTDERGFLRTNEFLQIDGFSELFASGDCGSNIITPHPKAGVYAVRQAPILFDNLIATVVGHELRKFQPQRDFLSLLRTNGNMAIGSRKPFAFSGAWVWRLKDYIDRKFMRMFSELDTIMDATLPATILSEAARQDAQIIHCQGCATKASKSALSLAIGSNHDLGTDAAIIETPPGQLLIQANDFISAPCKDAYLFGQLIAVHATNDVISEGAQPHSALVNLGIPDSVASIKAQVIQQVNAGISHVLEQMQAQIVGGHTAKAETLSAGLSVNAFAPRDRLWKRSNVGAGQKIILTKALGSGILFRAMMLGEAKGRWLDAAFKSLLKPHHELLAPSIHAKIIAATDITGFGLAAHLENLLPNDTLSLGIEIDELPLYEGVREMLAEGIRSSASSDNQRAASIQISTSAKQHPHLPIIFDPQTSGPMALVVADDDVQWIIKELVKLGFDQASIIGAVVERNQAMAPLSIT